MRKIVYIIALVIVAFAALFAWAHKDDEIVQAITTPAVPIIATSFIPIAADSILFDVPFVSEAPDDNWVSPWKDACEEASLAMVENYYKGKKTVGITEAKDFMSILFDAQNKKYRSNMNASSERMMYLISNFTSFKAEVRTDPTIEEIKDELRAKRPVISLHRGFDLNNSNIRFLSSGSSYHVIVITGFDDAKNEFITNDPGDREEGLEHRYSYETIMSSLHDYNHKTYTSDGPARVIFTFL